MDVRAFFTAEGRARVERAVRAVESVTSAEVVVAVHPHSGVYRHTDLSVGVFCAFVSLLIFLFDPHPFAIDAYPFAFLTTLFGATLASEHLPPLRRLLTARRTMDDAVHRAARTVFVDSGIGRTRGRTGILVFVSILERRVEVVADVGVDAPHLEGAIAALDRALAASRPFEPFVAALEGLREPLASLLPHQADDVDELPNAMQEAS